MLSALLVACATEQAWPKVCPATLADLANFVAERATKGARRAAESFNELLCRLSCQASPNEVASFSIDASVASHLGEIWVGQGFDPLRVSQGLAHFMGYSCRTKYPEGVYVPIRLSIVDGQLHIPFMLPCPANISVPTATACVLTDSTLAEFRPTVFRALRSAGYDLRFWWAQGGI